MKQPPGLCSEGGGLDEAKLATHVLSSLSVMLPPQPASPLQPRKVEPLSATALSVTFVLAGNCAWHDVPHRIPAGVELTVPIPVPARAIVSVCIPPISRTGVAGAVSWLT